MKKIFSVLVVFTLALNMMAQGIEFNESDWKSILAEAKAENKIIFVDAYTTWCGPCKKMASQVFPQPKVGAFYNKTFINAKIDMEKGEGIDIAKKYDIRAYPTFLFINGDGALVHIGLGGRSEAQFIDLGKAASNPDMQLMSLQQKYKKGEREGLFMTRYIAALQDGGMDFSAVSNEYLATLKSYDSPEIMNFIFETTETPKQKGFQIMADNLEAYYDFFGKEKVQNKMDFALKKAYFSNMEKMIASYKQYFPKDAKKLTAGYKVGYYMYARSEDANDKFVAAAIDYIEHNNADNSIQLNTIAWHIYEISDDKELLEMACKWAEKSVAIDSNYMNTDTVANLYFKLGNKKEALKWAKIAIAHAAETNEDASYTTELLKQIEAM